VPPTPLGRALGSSIALALLGAGPGAPTAAAQGPQRGPDVDVSRCTSLDRAEVSRTIAVELASLDAAIRTALASSVLLVDCPDAVTANLRVEPVVRGAPATRSVDLTDLPSEFRLRLVALAGAELLTAIARATPSVDATRPRPVRTPAGGGVDPADPASMRDRAPLERGADERPGEPVRLAPVPRPIEPPPAPPPRVDGDTRSPRLRHGLVQQLAGTAPMMRWGLAARGGVRGYRMVGPVIPHLAVDVERGPVAVGLVVAASDREVELGTLTSRLYAGSVGLAVACSGDPQVGFCAGARGVVGLAAARGTPSADDQPQAIATVPLQGLYLQGSGWLEVSRRIGSLAALLVLEAGYAGGIIATGGDAASDEVALAGVLLEASAGVRW
jgi:hypothetical protein